MFYELIIQKGLWFTVTFFVLILFDTESNLLQYILWISSGVYFVWSWACGGQTLAMRAWKLKLICPYDSLWFYFIRYIFVTIGAMLFFTSFLWVFFNKKNQYLHDFILGSKIIDVRI